MLLEMQQAAEWLLDVVHLAHRVFGVAHAHLVDAERGTLVALREPRHQVERGGDVAASGKIRERTVGMAVQLGGGLGEEAPRLERAALPVVPLVEHCFHANAGPFPCCDAP
jgi:hypothetical protein